MAAVCRMRRILGAGFAHKRISHRRCPCALSDFVRHLHRKCNRLLRLAVSVQNRRTPCAHLFEFPVRLLRGAMRLSRHLRQLYAAVPADARRGRTDQLQRASCVRHLTANRFCRCAVPADSACMVSAAVTPRCFAASDAQNAASRGRSFGGYLCADQRRSAPAGRRHGISPADQYQYVHGKQRAPRRSHRHHV